MNRSEIIALFDQYVMPTYGRLSLVLVRGQGARVWDAEGHEYLDWIGAWGPALLGHAHPAIVAAVQRAAERWLVFGLASPPEAAQPGQADGPAAREPPRRR